ncbi:MAG: Dabb family protein [Legionellales bacterium]|nr:Dabb family protein [Legionellales bacterium]
MIRHTILFKVKPSVTKQAIEMAIAHFIALKNKLPGIISFLGGECEFHEESANRRFTHVFFIDFENEATLDTFFHDAVTHPAKEEIIRIAEGGYEGLTGFNLKV